jgi:DNA mismatch endonuclease (patch repair protein)
MSPEGRRRVMASIRSTDTKPELALRRAMWALGLRGWRCQWRGPGGRVDVAFTRWRVAVFVDGVFWHGHPSKWQPGRWTGYWDEKIQRNMARDRAQNAALAEAGWTVLRLWDLDIERDPQATAAQVARVLDIAQNEARRPGASGEPATRTGDGQPRPTIASV